MLALSNLTSAKIIDSSKNTHKYPTTGYISISDGYGFPMGKFASKSGSFDNENGAGFAEKGNYTSLDFAAPIKHSHFGISASFGYYNNPLDNPAFNNNMSGSYYYNNYTLYTAMAGLYVTYPFKHFSYDLKIQAGLCASTYPSFAYSGLYNYQPLNLSGSSANCNSLAYQGVFSVRYYPSKGHLFVIGQINYFGTSANYTINESNYSQQSITQVYSILGIVGGLGLKF